MTQISCEKCDGKLKESREVVPFESKAIGKIFVPGVHHYKCSKCGSSMVSYVGAGTLLKYVREKENEAIGLLPAKDFLSLNEAAYILGISKQAFNKNSQIKKGFIYSMIIGGRRHYYKKSVEEFKLTGKDGRILLAVNTQDIDTLKTKEIDKPKHVNKFTENIDPLPWQIICSMPSLIDTRIPNVIYASHPYFSSWDKFITDFDIPSPDICNMLNKKERMHVRKIK